MELLLDKLHPANLDRSQPVGLRRRYHLNLNLFYLAFIVNSAAHILVATGQFMGSLFQGIQLVAIGILLFVWTRLFGTGYRNSYFFFMLVLFLLWQLLIFLRGDYSGMEYKDYKYLIFDANYGAPHLLIPLFFLVPVKLVMLKKLFDAAFLCGLIYIFLSVLFYKELLEPDYMDMAGIGVTETLAKFLALPMGILLMTAPFQNKKRILFALFVLLIMTIVVVFKARRGLIFFSGIILLTSSALYFYNKPGRVIPLLIITLLSGLWVLLVFDKSEIFGLSVFNNIKERKLQDTRSGVEECFFNDMSVSDWLVGKGFNSGYNCYVFGSEGRGRPKRKVIETDYLQLIMYGGIVNIVLLLMIILPAIYLGIFRSKNLLAKGMAAWILFWLICLYPSNVYSFHLFHYSVWLCAALCYSSKFRGYKDGFLKLYLQEKNSQINYHNLKTNALKA